MQQEALENARLALEDSMKELRDLMTKTNEMYHKILISAIDLQKPLHDAYLHLIDAEQNIQAPK